MILEVLADAGQMVDGLDTARFNSALSPMPESIRIFGELMAPAERMTSRVAATLCPGRAR